MDINTVQPQPAAPSREREPLRRSHNGSSQEPEHELLCVGFGVAALSAAVTLEEQGKLSSTTFLERQGPELYQQWKPVPETYMQTSFLKDLATARNPLSKYTLTNWMQKTGRMLDFSNLGKLQVNRQAMKEYLSWCSDDFQGKVRFNCEVKAVYPITNEDGKLGGWNVIVLEGKKKRLLSTKRLLVAAGAQPYIPQELSSPTIASQVVHVSRCVGKLEDMLRRAKTPLNVAIVGGGQEAAEVFWHMHELAGLNSTTMFISDSALRPRDTNPFLSQLLGPNTRSRVPSEIAASLHPVRNATSQDSVSLELIEQIYEAKLTGKYPHTVVPNRMPTSAVATHDGRVILNFRDPTTGEGAGNWQTPFDLIIAATGYRRETANSIFSPIKSLMSEGQLCVDRGYSVNLREGLAAPKVGLWMVGGFDKGSDVGDDVFEGLAHRSQLAIKSIKECEKQEESGLAKAKPARL